MLRRTPALRRAAGLLIYPAVWAIMAQECCMECSALQKARYGYQPKLPVILRGEVDNISVQLGEATTSAADSGALAEIFKNTFGKPFARFVPGKNPKIGRKLTAGVILSGGQAPGGHNVIAGLYDGLKKGNRDSVLLGFKGGPSGLLDDKALLFTDEIINRYRNTGGFDIIGSGRTKIETPEQFASALETAKKRKLDAVVIIGGDDSNTNAALLAEYFIAQGTNIQVIGCPKTIDGDLKNAHIETSFGFDTAVKTYSELISNIGRDAASARKYWHFIKLMGRSASHIALECALQTQPNVCLISEEIEAKKMSLQSIVEQICASVNKRAENKDNFGVVLVPEGLVEFVPEMKKLISEINDLVAGKPDEFSKITNFIDQICWLDINLSKESSELFKNLPPEIGTQLLADRDPHGNVQVSRIETEKLLIGMVQKRLAELKQVNAYQGKFSALAHFFGYEGRCAFPSNFDADYCYSLGFSAFVLIASGLTAYISSVKNLCQNAGKWEPCGVPLTMMMNLERRHGSSKPVIKKALVELDGKPFKAFAEKRASWSVNTEYLFTGAVQYYGPPEVCDQPTKTLRLEHYLSGE
jgi:pyrophosphate--fructose-6-phosphate 1-phosphotransferase